MKKFPATIDHIDKYVASGEKLKKFVKHRHVPLEKSEIKARKSRIDDMLKEEFSLEHIDKENIPDKAVMRKLKRVEASHLCRLEVHNRIKINTVYRMNYTGYSIV